MEKVIGFINGDIQKIRKRRKLVQNVMEQANSPKPKKNPSKSNLPRIYGERGSMREDTQEYLDKMFPDGWCLVYIQKNRDFRFSHYAPDEGAKDVIAPFWGLAKRVIRSQLFGYFEYEFETKPAHDPGLDVDCLFCLKRLSEPLKTISLMKDGDKRSFFYRSHKDCYENASPEKITEYESQLIDGIEP